MVKLFFLVLAPLLALDGLWLLWLGKPLYQRAIGFLMPESVPLLPVVIAYLLLGTGLLFFVVSPGLNGGFTLSQIFLRGALLGLVVYGVYDTTNLATIKGFPYWIAGIDVLWGMFVSGTTAVIASFFARLWS